MHNVLLAASRHGMRRVVFTSSVQALGCFIGLGRPDYLPLDDAHRPDRSGRTECPS
jgi:nucleoside-diphosphate-sugar epimerase